MSVFDSIRKKKKIPAPWSKFYSKEEMNIKIPNISMYEEIRRNALKYPNDVAIVYLNRKITFYDLLKKIDIVANGFYDLGIRRGDVVTIVLPNVPESLISLYALNKIGAIANMTHPLSAEEEIKEAITTTKSRYLIIYNARYSKIENYIDNINVEKVIFVSPADSLDTIRRVGYKVMELRKFKHRPLLNRKYINFRTFFLLSRFKDDFPQKRFGKNTPAVILHSGGTSGKSKNVVIQNRAFTFAAKSENIILTFEKGDSALAIMPNFHGFGLSTVMHTPLALGLTTILVPQFNAKKFGAILKKNKPTCILGVPTLYEAFINANNEKNLDLSFIKYIICGGDALPSALEDKVNDFLEMHNSSAKIIQGYGLTEALACVTLTPDEVQKKGSAGIPLPGNYIKIIDPTNRKTKKPGEKGEIVINSKAFMMGYLNDEKETNEALQVHPDGHVWLHTGDLGYMDEDGFLFYCGRSKRMIITSGYNVYPSHIEEILESHPAVLQCTVVGVPHPYKQEVPKAFVVLNDNSHGLFIKAELKKYCAKHLAKYMMPSDIVIRKKLPKTKLGKVDFNKLKEDNNGDEI